MERKKASDFPAELMNLFDKYVHGAIDRRGFLDGAQKFAVGGVTASALLEMLKPNYALAAQVAKDDGRIKIETVTVPSPRATAPSRVIWHVQRTRQVNYRWFWSSTKTAASTPTSKMWRGGLRSPDISPWRRTG